MRKIVFFCLLMLLAIRAGVSQSIYNQSGTAAVSCSAVTTTGACTYYTLPNFNGYTLPSSFSWETIYTGSPTGTTVNFEGSIDGRTSLDGVATASSTTFTSATLKFTAADVTKDIYIGGSGAAGGTFHTTIASVTNSTTVVLTAAPTLSMSGAPTFVGSFYQLDQTVNTSGEFRSVVNKSVKFVRCNVTTFSGGTSPTAYCAFVAKGA